jgi:Leucine-rich repeat (LRR) protein
MLPTLKEYKYTYEINVNDHAIKDITILRDFKNLRYLDLADNHITDISPLINLTDVFFAISINFCRRVKS